MTGADAGAKFVADPFVIRLEEHWYLFFEVLSSDTQQGDIALATSKDLLEWDFRGVVIDEAFHLSFPYVFSTGDEYYMILESAQGHSVRLYRAEVFPEEWKLERIIFSNQDFVDNAILQYQGYWWLFGTKLGQGGDSERSAALSRENGKRL